MLIWIIALAFVGLNALVSYNQGAIKAGFSTVGLLLGALLAMPLSTPMEKLLKVCGVNHPLFRELIAPAIVFFLILIVSKMIAYSMHRKAEYTYTYKRTEQERVRFNRLMPQLGLCIGILNGVIYFILLMVPIYVLGYLTVQLQNEGNDPAVLKFLSKAREQLHSTKMDKVAAGFSPADNATFEAFDIIGLVYKNPLLESRLMRYPSVLTIAERPEFQQLANSSDFHNIWHSGGKVTDVINHPDMKNLMTNSTLVAEIQKTLGPDLKDLRHFLETGQTEKYAGEAILGVWELNTTESFNAEKRRRANVSSVELKQLRARLIAMSGTTLNALTDKRVLIKAPNKAANNQVQVVGQGAWSGDGSYHIDIDGKSEDVTISDNKLNVVYQGMALVFERAP